MPDPREELLRIEQLADGARRTVALHGELDLATAERAAAALAEAFSSDGGGVVLDLTDVAFMDASGARVVEATRARAARDGHELVIRIAPGAVARCLDLCGLLDGPGFLWGTHPSG
jgi:anti-sigma B factor antagonist